MHIGPPKRTKNLKFCTLKMADYRHLEN